MIEYAKTPWRVQHPHVGARGWEVADSSGLNQVCQDVSEANARRIAACVNACDGVPEGLLHAGAYREMMQAQTELTIQRDALLAALVEMVAMMDSGEEHGAGSEWHWKATAAIAAAKAGAQ